MEYANIEEKIIFINVAILLMINEFNISCPNPADDTASL